jgi:hypothetical protein
MTPTRTSSNSSIGYVLPTGTENNPPGTTEEIPRSKRVNHDPNLKLPQSSWYQPREPFGQPLADRLDLIFGDFTSKSDDMDDMNEFSFYAEPSLVSPPSHEESFKERDADSPGNGDIFGPWNQYDNELDFSYEIPDPEQPD